ncbi:MAG: hypothetical protein Q7V62_02280 [Actinomycetota bacterium]|nr:hypothetical protein [Actinomycetota bacterium]
MKDTLGVSSSVCVPLAGAVIETDGLVVSMVICRASDRALTLPAASVAVIAREYTPSGRVAEADPVQLPLASAFAVPAGVPFRYPVTRDSGSAVPRTAPLTSLVMTSVGGSVITGGDGGTVSTMKLRVDVETLLAESV